MKSVKEVYADLSELIKGIEAVVDKEYNNGLKSLFFIGNGGTYSYGMPIEFMAKRMTTFPIFNEQSAEITACGHKFLGEGSLCIFESATGNTPDLNKAMAYTRSKGAHNLAIVYKKEEGNKEESPMKALADYFFEVDHDISKFAYYEPAFRVMNLHGDFAGYDKMWSQIATAEMGEALENAGKIVRNRSVYFAARNHDPNNQIFLVGAGATYGAAYCLGMCVLEEMQWLHTRIIHAGEFFHGCLELVEKDTPFIIIKGEDEDRALIERVEKFIAPLTNEVVVYDTKEIPLPIDDEFRPLICSIVCDSIIYELDKPMQDNTNHDLKKRRYYRYMNY